MTDVTDLTIAQAEIRRRVAAIGAEQWGLPTPCTEWTVADLVAHMVGGSRMTVLLLEGASAHDSLAPFDAERGPDPAAELDTALVDELEAFSGPGAFERDRAPPCGRRHPGNHADRVPDARTTCCTAGTSPAPRAATNSCTRASSLPCGTGSQPMAPFIGQIGVFGSGPSGTVGEDAPLQQRLLDLTGRRP